MIKGVIVDGPSVIIYWYMLDGIHINLIMPSGNTERQIVIIRHLGASLPKI